MSQIPRIILDPDDDQDLLTQMYIRCEASSGGKITDFRQGSVIASLYEGVAYSLSELLWYLNLTPEAIALEVMRYSTGLERIDGTKASGTLAFVLDSTKGYDFFISKNDIRIPWQDSYFVLDEDLVIPSGLLEAQATCSCVITGTKYNVPRTLDINYSPNMTGLQLVYNPLPITNATDLEPLPDTLARMQAFYRSSGSLINNDDFELKLSELAGNGSRVKAIPLLDNNLVPNTTGHIHLFLVNPDGELPTPAQCASLRADLREFTFDGIFTWVSPAVYDLVNINLVIQVTDISDDLAYSIGDTVREHFNYRSYPMGEVIIIDNLKYRIRRDHESEVVNILTTEVNGDSTDVPLTHIWSLPQISNLDIKLVDPQGSKQYYLGEIAGAGE